MGMTLDEAILHAEKVAEQCDRECKKVYPNAKSKCANEHRQLAEWLKELRQYREAMDVIKFEIDKKTVIHADGELYIKNIDVKRIINRYVSGKEKEE